MELNQLNKLVEATPTVPATETVTNVAPPPEPQPTKPVDQTSAQPSAPLEASTIVETTPPVQNVQTVEAQSGATPLFKFDDYVEGVSVPPDLDSIARFAAAFGQQSMQNPENSSSPSQGAK